MSFIVGCLIPGLVCAYVDWKKFIIPDSMVLVMFLAGLGYSISTGQIKSAVIGASIGFLITWICWKKKGLGGGDVKLTTALGMWFGYNILVVLFIGSLLTTIAGLVKMALNGKLSKWASTYCRGVYYAVVYGVPGTTTAPQLPDNFEEIHPDSVPFGTFLVAGAFIVYLIMLKGGFLLA